MKKLIATFISLLSLYGFTSYIPYRNITWVDVKKIDKNKLHTGDVIIINKRMSLYGIFGHSAIYIKESDKFADYPMLGKGSFFISYDSWINDEAEKNRKAVILRFKNADNKFRNDILKEIKRTKDKQYKIVLNKNDSSGYYCSQWIWKMFKDIRGVDIDANRGILALPYDFLLTKEFEHVLFN